MKNDHMNQIENKKKNKFYHVSQATNVYILGPKLFFFFQTDGVIKKNGVKG